MLLPPFASAKNTLITPMTLGLGMIALVAGVWLRDQCRAATPPPAARPFASAQRVSLLIASGLVAMALFWIADIWANQYGRARAEKINSELWAKETGVVVDTTIPLRAPPELILQTPPDDPGADGNGPREIAPRSQTYRYECFRTVAVHGDQWALVPAKWTPNNGYAVIVTADSDTRISVVKHADIVHQVAAKFDDQWPCLEVAP
jgi:hypothetical protein